MKYATVSGEGGAREQKDTGEGSPRFPRTGGDKRREGKGKERKHWKRGRTRGETTRRPRREEESTGGGGEWRRRRRRWERRKETWRGPVGILIGTSAEDQAPTTKVLRSGFVKDLSPTQTWQDTGRDGKRDTGFPGSRSGTATGGRRQSPGESGKK